MEGAMFTDPRHKRLRRRIEGSHAPNGSRTGGAQEAAISQALSSSPIFPPSVRTHPSAGRGVRRMAGHSKWKQIKHKKAAADAKRGAAFAKLIKEITIAARQGGGDPAANPRLRTAIDTAKAANMPSDNIDRAVKKGTGELEGVTYEEATYEGYGPGGAAIMLQVTTDNLNRTVAEIRHLFARHGANLASPGAVAWMFDKKGQMTLDATRLDEDAAVEAALEAGADDLTRDSEQYVITTNPSALHQVDEALRARGLEPHNVEIALIPTSTVRVEGGDAERLLRLMEAIDEHDDVSKVFSNFDIDADTLAAVGE
jgi:YebC/PmpR family DNA-binding regulatory protein